MTTDTERLSLMREALAYFRDKYQEKREDELAAASRIIIDDEFGGAQVMRLRARAAVWAWVVADLNDIIEAPIYRPATESGGIRKETGSENSSRGQV
jgi:hypothetical protein